MPGLRRPNTCIHDGAPIEQPVPARSMFAACCVIMAGIHSAGTAIGSMPVKSAGATPITVIG